MHFKSKSVKGIAVKRKKTEVNVHASVVWGKCFNKTFWFFRITLNSSFLGSDCYAI